jgi:hypothetical protein
MESGSLRRLVLLGLTVLVGCAAPQRPPSPARRLSVFELLSAPAEPCVRYYVMLFGSQATPKTPHRSHTWGMAIKVARLPGAPPLIETHTISWMPDSLDVRWWKLNVEPGSNFSNEFSIAHAMETGQRISAWGPYETWSGLYTRFVVQKEFLDADAVGYQCVDAVGEAARRGNGCDCFHALSDMDPYYDRRRYPIYAFGAAAARNIVRHLHERPTLVNPKADHGWLFDALGLDRYPITRRRYDGDFVEFSPEAVIDYVNREQRRRGRPSDDR